ANETRTAHPGSIDVKSDKAFLAVLTAVRQSRRSKIPVDWRGQPDIIIPDVGAATITTGRRGAQLKLELHAVDTKFITWLEGNAPQFLVELHERWKRSL
ncbi:MAG: plasmid partitioning protein RepB, partial [Roseovarius sp.]